MADNKKYYYLKLKDNFYESDAMILLESMENGYLYSNILMKMYLRSLRNNGKLAFNDKIPYNAQMLSKIVRHNVDIVEKAIKVFTGLELIDVLDNGTIYISDIQNFIGESSTEADRIRLYRNEIDQQKLVCTNVQQMYDKSTPEIDIEIELEKDIEIDINKEKTNKKENDKIILERFDEFWKRYPRKINKAKAMEWYLKHKPDEQTQKDIIWGIIFSSGEEQWKKDNGQFIPYPITFLNQKRWEDFKNE